MVSTYFVMIVLIEATVSLTLPAGDSAADVTLESSRPSVLVVPPTVAINSGQISEQFTIRTNELPDRGPSAVAVTVTASFGGRAVQQTIRVIRG